MFNASKIGAKQEIKGNCLTLNNLVSTRDTLYSFYIPFVVMYFHCKESCTSAHLKIK